MKPDDESVKQLNTKIGRCGLHYEEVETEEIRLRKRLDERARAYNDLYDKEQALKKKLSYTKLAFAGTTFALSVGFFAVRYLTMAQQPSTSADFNPSCRPCGGLGGD